MTERTSRESETRSDRILAELESGAALESLPGVFKLSASQVIQSLAAAALRGEDDLGPALIQALPARPWLARELALPSLGKLIATADRPLLLSLSAGLLQIHDFWDASHIAAQEADDVGEPRFSAYWHGIAHRREPDAGNAGYWFRRVGRHAIHPALASSARLLLEGAGGSQWLSQLLAPTGWNNTAMIELCTRARPRTQEETLARRLQRLEMQALLQANLVALTPLPGN